MNKLGMALFIGLVFQPGYAEDIPTNPNMRPPASPTMPQSGRQPISGSDSYTQQGPTSQMNTITTQSTGTSRNYTPESHPIPLDKAPAE